MPTIPEISLDNIGDKNLASQIRQLFQVVEYLVKENLELRAENQKLRNEIARLTKRSGKPTFADKRQLSPSQDNPGKKTWSKSAKKATLKVDHVVDIPEIQVCECGSHDLSPLRTVSKLIQDIIITTNNSLYKGSDQKCNTCGKLYTAAIPEEIKGLQFGPVLRSWISAFKFDFRMPQGIIHRFVTGLGIEISAGQISNILIENGVTLTPAYTHLVTEGMRKACYTQTDVTGHKQRAQDNSLLHHYLHFVGNKFLSIFKVTAHYNSSSVTTVLGKRACSKPIISDDYSAYGAKLLVAIKQLCWIHEVRHYRELKPIVFYHIKILKRVIGEIWDWYHMAKTFKGNPVAPLRQELEVEFEKIFTQITGYEELDACLARTLNKKARLLAFLDSSFLPIHNNQSEQDVRDGVMIRKISRETKTHAGTLSFTKHLSIIHTAKKQGLNVFDTLHGLLTGTLSPSILTIKFV